MGWEFLSMPTTICYFNSSELIKNVSKLFFVFIMRKNDEKDISSVDSLMAPDSKLFLLVHCQNCLNRELEFVWEFESLD